MELEMMAKELAEELAAKDLLALEGMEEKEEMDKAAMLKLEESAEKAEVEMQSVQVAEVEEVKAAELCLEGLAAKELAAEVAMDIRATMPREGM